MPQAKLTIRERGSREPLEISVKSGLITFGRAADNTVSLDFDQNISRRHAEIERRGDNFYFTDLNSRNGSFINDEPVAGERRLQNGDRINLGGETTIEFKLEEPISIDENPSSSEPQLDFSAAQNPIAANSTPEVSPTRSKIPIVLAVVAVLCGLAVVAAIGTILFLSLEPTCKAEVSIVSPETGATLSENTQIRVATTNAKCIENVSYRLDGNEFANTSTPPYAATIDLEKFPDFVDDQSMHVLTVAIVGKDNVPQIQESEIKIAFAAKKAKKNERNETPETVDEQSVEAEPSTPNAAQISLAETKEMCERVVKLYSRNLIYRFDAQFLKAVQAKTASYKTENFSARAQKYRDLINAAFFSDKGLPAPLGFHLAMWRSGFQNRNAAAKEGLWQMTNEFARANGYDGLCAGESLSDAGQNCAARVAAAHAKNLFVNTFDNDIVFGVACFDSSGAEVGAFKNSLPVDRADFWNVAKSQSQRERIVGFFAAAIVAENPAKFGLKRDQPLVALYQNLLPK